MTDLDPAGDPVAIGILLTDAEHAVIRQAGDLWGSICSVVADGPTRDADLRKLITHVHAIQHAVMAQAASRAHPDLYRALGATIPSPASLDVSPQPSSAYVGTVDDVDPAGRGATGAGEAPPPMPPGDDPRAGRLTRRQM